MTGIYSLDSHLESQISSEIFQSREIPYLRKQLNYGDEYQIHGVALFSSLQYLVVVGTDPLWVPAQFFISSDCAIPRGWSCRTTQPSEKHLASFIMSYRDLVESKDHFDGLSVLNKSDVRKFFDSI